MKLQEQVNQLAQHPKVKAASGKEAAPSNPSTRGDPAVKQNGTSPEARGRMDNTQGAGRDAPPSLERLTAENKQLGDRLNKLESGFNSVVKGLQDQIGDLSKRLGADTPQTRMCPRSAGAGQGQANQGASSGQGKQGAAQGQGRPIRVLLPGQGKQGAAQGQGQANQGASSGQGKQGAAQGRGQANQGASSGQGKQGAAQGQGQANQGASGQGKARRSPTKATRRPGPMNQTRRLVPSRISHATMSNFAHASTR